MLEQGILRKEWFAGEQRVEISHDLLLRPIKRAIEKRLVGAARRRIVRRWAIGAAAAIGVLGLVVYGSYMKIQFELSQRETTAEALLVAYTPAQDRSDPTAKLKDKMASLIVDLDSSSGAADGARNLQAIFDGAVEFGKSTDPDNARRLQEVAIEYLQMKIERGHFAQTELSPLLRDLHGAVDASCVKGYLQAGDGKVTWFADRGGVPASCR